jgi:deoxyribose-phosphate aldolase
MKLNKPLNKYFDHTLLKPDATRDQILALCREAIVFDFYAVCVNSSFVADAVQALSQSNVKVAAVVGFPLGACTSATKAFEAAEACKAGADEIDMVIALGPLTSGEDELVRQDIAAVTRAAEPYGAKVKVILETCLLTDEEIIKGCRLAEAAGAHFVKTSTGFSTGGATTHHVELMKSCVGDRLQVKASGGIRTLEDTLAMIEAGADRIGASASAAIMKEFRQA